MRRLLCVAMIAGTAVWAADASRAKAVRAELVSLEQSFDRRMASVTAEVPFDLLGATRGVYLEGFGAVFTAEVGLIQVPGISPFRPALTREEIDRIRERKLAQLPRLRQAMREWLAASAALLNSVPAEERIVIGVTLFRYSWEDGRGLPGQLLMQAQRKVLLDFQAGRISRDALQAAIRVEEF